MAQIATRVTGARGRSVWWCKGNTAPSLTRFCLSRAVPFHPVVSLCGIVGAEYFLTVGWLKSACRGSAEGQLAVEAMPDGPEKC